MNLRRKNVTFRTNIGKALKLEIRFFREHYLRWVNAWQFTIDNKASGYVLSMTQNKYEEVFVLNINTKKRSLTYQSTPRGRARWH